MCHCGCKCGPCSCKKKKEEKKASVWIVLVKTSATTTTITVSIAVALRLSNIADPILRDVCEILFPSWCAPDVGQGPRSTSSDPLATIATIARDRGYTCIRQGNTLFVGVGGYGWIRFVDSGGEAKAYPEPDYNRLHETDMRREYAELQRISRDMLRQAQRAARSRLQVSRASRMRRSRRGRMRSRRR